MSSPNHIDLVIFDLDGTLIHSAPDIVATTNELMRRKNLAPLDEAVIVDAIGEGLMQLVYSCFPETHGNPELLDQIAQDFAVVYEENMIKRTTIFDGIEKFLDAATATNAPSGAGNRSRKVAIVTNKRMKWTEHTLKGLKLDRYPWVKVFGADSLAERKPHPLPLLEVMKAAQVRPENTVMVGDGLPDMGAARRAGVHAIGCSYGYCSAEKLTKAGASLLIQSPYDLNDALEAASRLAPRKPTP